MGGGKKLYPLSKILISIVLGDCKMVCVVRIYYTNVFKGSGSWWIKCETQWIEESKQEHCIENEVTQEKAYSELCQAGH